MREQFPRTIPQADVEGRLYLAGEVTMELLLPRPSNP